ncbi:MAG: LytTR family DNA-binding domain-containing protein [Tannerellaceae bacterium]|jgi:DNA-binding LytR/AlgR family response regulator|nr:LytTR family DNA-binding domain-containing protein [Tannerellaceae bacterium]
MILTCAIIDDEPLAVSLLESYANKTPFLKLSGTYNSAVDALAELEREAVELLFLDIQMPELNGMEFSRMVTNDTRIIFTTAFGQYALDSYKVNALDYLLKPISYPSFLQSAQKALQWYELLHKPGANPAEAAGKEREPESVFIKSEYKLIRIELSKILYIEGLKDYVKIYIEDQTRPLLSLMSMKNMEELLPASRFIRVHRSFIVQPEKIKAIERNRIVFGKEYIPISDSYRDGFNAFLSKHSLFLKM